MTCLYFSSRPFFPFYRNNLTLTPDPTIHEDYTNSVEELEHHWSLLERAVEATKTGIIIIDQRRPDWPIVYCNSGFEQMTGYDRVEILGENYRFLLEEDSIQPGLSEARTAMLEGRDATVILRNYRKDGTIFLNELNLSPVKDNTGAVINIIGTMRDVTHQNHGALD
jgi:PAS domain S-box-containing protein